MKVILKIRDEPDQIELDSHPHALSIQGRACRVIVPTVDPWTNYVEYGFDGSDVKTEVHGERVVIEFADGQSRTRFHTWLVEAFAEATEGYRTMWPRRILPKWQDTKAAETMITTIRATECREL